MKVDVSAGPRPEKMMKPKFLQTSAKKVIGIAKKVKHNEGFKECPDFWGYFLYYNIEAEIPNRINPHVLYSVIVDEDDYGFTYIIGAEVTCFHLSPVGMVGREISGSYYAVFTAKGPSSISIHSTYTNIFNSWFPQSGYQYAAGAALSKRSSNGLIKIVSFVIMR